MLQLLPVTSDPNQTFNTTLQINEENIVLNFAIRWNQMGHYWMMTIKDDDDNILIDSLPIVNGEDWAANLLSQFDYLEIGSLWLINISGSTLDRPDDKTLGTDFLLVWDDNE